jgi:hypothetical protein
MVEPQSELRYRVVGIRADGIGNNMIVVARSPNPVDSRPSGQFGQAQNRGDGI